MKNIYVMSLDDAVKELRSKKNRFAVIYVFANKDAEPAIRINTSSRRKKGCVDVVELAINELTYDWEITNWQADTIIRFCERCFDVDDIYVVHDDRYNVAVNIAYELSVCYKLGFDVDYNNIHNNNQIRKIIRAKYIQVSNSLLHKLAPMDYCKTILSIVFNHIKDVIEGNRIEGFNSVNFFWHCQCTIVLRNGLYFYCDLETTLANIYIPDMDDIEYVQFSGVPEIADPSGYEEDNKEIFCIKYGDDDLVGIFDYYGFDFSYNSEDGLTYGEKPLPEKYRNYKFIQRYYYDFIKNNSKGHEYAFPEMKRAFLGMVKAENFLAARNGYTPKFCQLPRRFIEFRSFITEEYDEHLNQYIAMMRENNIWDGNEFETACLYAAYFYMGSLLEHGHCENMTILSRFYKSLYRDLKELPEFDKFWNIDKYVPTTDDDPVNILCLAAYTLIETVRSYELQIPDDAFMKCLERIYDLTEGRPELNYAVILTGLFAGAYCQTVD